ncbi:MAG: TetR/AcrR family transcriptional regulator [Sedimentisphaerales bacterium]|nr:TetR/AcrR family transcriptional regulator [Sedimentisphaerales bacterium]
MTRKEREKQRRRFDILEAAEIIFAEKGFDRTTVEDIAAHSEFAVGTLYNLFSGKEQLYNSLIEIRSKQMSAEVNAVLDKTKGPLEMVRAYVNAKIKLFTKYQYFVCLYSRERLGDRFINHDLWRETIAPLYNGVLSRLVDAIRAGVSQGIFRNDIDPEDIVIALEGLTDGFVYAWLENPDTFPFEEKEQSMIDFFISGALAK